jgi:cation-transporting ATPase E
MELVYIKIATFLKKLLKKNKASDLKKAPLAEPEIDLVSGLTEEQINDRILKGHTNHVRMQTTKSIPQIFFVSIVNFFNLLCFAIFVWILTTVRAFEDLLNVTFMFIVIANTGVGIFQEIKAKKILDRLSLMTSTDVRVMRKGDVETIKLNDILLGDVVLLSAGEKICSDSYLAKGTIEVNESLLTGESLPIKKMEGDKLLAGSFVVSGNGKSIVEKVGEDNFVQQIAAKAKEQKENKSELVRSVKLIMRIIGIIVVPLAILSTIHNYSMMLLRVDADPSIVAFEVEHVVEETPRPSESAEWLSRRYFEGIINRNLFTPEERDWAFREATVFTAGSILGMVPIGMFMLTSVTFAIGIIKLYGKKTLVQYLYSIETLARVNTICLDKTGTITDGTMKVVRVLELENEKTNKKTVAQIISSMQDALDENNATALALKDYFSSENIMPHDFTIPFSSDRKCSAVYLRDVGLCVLGAPEYATNKLSQKVISEMNFYQSGGSRCLLLAINNSKTAKEKREIPEFSTPVALIVIEDNIKHGAENTIKMFKENKVEVKIISGDNPQTVSAIAKRIGVPQADKYISLMNMTEEEVKQVAKTHTVFGRVNPYQKKLLVQIFKNNGRTVAMMGDGVNDILALKEADCSIAMANGSDAARDTAHLVLLENDFAAVPAIINEGRRAINNVERASTLFITMAAFSVFFILSLVILGIAYPLEPIHLSLTSVFVIGFASTVIAIFEPNYNKVEGKFLPKLVRNVIPPAFAMLISVIVLMLLRENFAVMSSNISNEQYQTMIAVTIFGIGALLLYYISKPLNALRTGLLVTVVACGVFCILVMPLLDFNIFRLSSLTNGTAEPFALLIAFLFSANKIIQIARYFIKRYDNREIK